MSYGRDGLSTGHRVKIDGEFATLIDFKNDSRDWSFSSGHWVVKFDDGRTEEIRSWNLGRSQLVYDEHAFKLGDRVEVKLEDPMVDTFPRGKVIAIDPEHPETPYTVTSLDGTITSKFALYEINKILTALSWEKRGASKEALAKLVAEKRVELQALEIALEVLEFAAGADKG